MAQDNVELHRRLYQAWNSSDVDELVAVCDPSVEVRSVFAAVGGAVYEGHDGVRSWRRDLDEAWGGGFHIEPEAFFDLDDHTLGFVVLHGRGEQSGVEAAMSAAGLATWRDGLCLSHTAYIHREDALKALGVSEDALERIDP